jgi:hypothetical protein
VKIQKPFNGFYIVDSPASLSGKSGMGIPKGFSPPAQGWRFSANPGERRTKRSTPTALRQRPSNNMQNRHNPFQGCEFDFFSPWAGGRNPFGIHTAIEFCKRLLGWLVT